MTRAVYSLRSELASWVILEMNSRLVSIIKISNSKNFLKMSERCAGISVVLIAHSSELKKWLSSVMLAHVSISSFLLQLTNIHSLGEADPALALIQS